MDNQHQKITGYRDLSQEEIDLMNEGKALAEQCGAFIAKLREHTDTRMAQLRPVDDIVRTPTLDQRWVSIGATHLQEGWMAVIRGIAQPTSF